MMAVCLCLALLWLPCSMQQLPPLSESVYHYFGRSGNAKVSQEQVKQQVNARNSCAGIQIYNREVLCFDCKMLYNVKGKMDAPIRVEHIARLMEFVKFLQESINVDPAFTANVDMVVCTDDAGGWVVPENANNPTPILQAHLDPAKVGQEKAAYIPMPMWARDHWDGENTLLGWGGTYTQLAAQQTPQTPQKEVAFFRGSFAYDCGSEGVEKDQLWWTCTRGAWFQQGLQHPDTVDAKPSAILNPKFSENTLPWQVDRVPETEWEKYKYIGVVGNFDHYTDRGHRMLLAPSLNLIPQDTSEVFFTRLMKPWVHYVPIKADATNLHETVMFLRNHPEQTQTIINNAQSLGRELLKPEKIQEYFRMVANTYKLHLDYEPTRVNPALTIAQMEAQAKSQLEVADSIEAPNNAFLKTASDLEASVQVHLEQEMEN